MNPKTKPEFHPDADTLNAFAERVLSSGQYAQVLAHVSDCARCREVVYLAQTAAEAGIVAEGKGIARTREMTSIFARWRVSLIPATALAAVGGIVLWVHVHPVAKRTEMAEVVAPKSLSAPAAPPTTANAAVAERSARPNAMPTRQAAERFARREGKSRQTAGRHDKEEVAQNAPASVPSVPVGGNDGYNALPMGGRSGSRATQAPRGTAFTAGSAEIAGSTRNREWQQSAMAPGAANRSLAVQAAPPPAPAPPNFIDVHGVAMGPTGGPEPAVVETEPQMALTKESLNGFARMQLSRRARLPSGLNSISSAAMLNRLVAVDSAGSVFLSQDGGKHWESVRSQWTGKAIAVQAPPESLLRVNTSAQAEPSAPVRFAEPRPAASDKRQSAKLAPAPATEALPPGLPMLFRLVTDRHQSWVSADGEVWREQDAPTQRGTP